MILIIDFHERFQYIKKYSAKFTQKILSDIQLESYEAKYRETD